MKRIVLVILAAICVFVMGIIGGIYFLGNKNALAASLTQQAQDNISKIEVQLKPDNELHLKYQTYQRYGSLAQTIAKIPFSTPETSYCDLWLRVDTTSSFSYFHSKVTGIAGELYQESELKDNKIVFNNTTKSLDVDNTSISVNEYLQYTANRIDRLVKQDWQIVDSGMWNGMKTVVLEKENAYPFKIPSSTEASYDSTTVQFPDESVNNESYSDFTEKPSNIIGTNEPIKFSIPYFEDLKPTKIKNRIEISIDNPLFTNEQVFVIDERGNEVNVMEHITIDVTIE